MQVLNLMDVVQRQTSGVSYGLTENEVRPLNKDVLARVCSSLVINLDAPYNDYYPFVQAVHLEYVIQMESGVHRMCYSAHLLSLLSLNVW